MSNVFLQHVSKQTCESGLFGGGVGCRGCGCCVKSASELGDVDGPRPEIGESDDRSEDPDK